MRRVVTFVTLVLVFTASPIFADIYGGTGNLNQTEVNIYGIDCTYGNGGEFTISNSILDTSGYISGITSEIKGELNSFQTFCIEMKEFTASDIEIVISTTSINESTGEIGPEGSGSHAVYGSLEHGDNLDPETAFLYTKFATGTLSNYDYSNSLGIGRDVSAGQLQTAIWYLEGENVTLVDGSQAAIWVDEAIGSGWNDIGYVRILNNWAPGHVGEYDYRKQDQLYLMPTPVPTSVILGLLGLGVVGIKLRKYA